MDDERRPDASADVPDATEPEPPAASATDPVPPPLVDWTAPSAAPAGWETLVRRGVASRIDVGVLFARTLDTFLAGWRTFIVLGIPTAITGTLIQFLAFDLRTPTNAGTSVLLSLIAIPINLGVLLSMIVAADDIRAGRPASVGSALRRGVPRAGVAIVSGIAVLLACLGMGLLVVLGLAILLVIPSVGTILAVVFGIAGVAIVIYALLRMSMFVAPITLDRTGPIEGFKISWRLVIGHMWRLGVLFVAVYLLVFPLGLASAFLTIGASPIVGGVVGILAFLVTGALPAIALSLAYGDLSGRPRAEQPPGQPRRGLFAAAVLVGGILLAVPSVALAVPRLGELALSAIPAQDRGAIYFGTAASATNPCAPLGRATTFDTSDPIYIGGYFSRTVLPGGSASIHVYLDGEEIVNSPIQAGAQAVACYYEPEPLVGAPTGSYRIVIDDTTGTLAEGAFTVR